MKNVFGVLRSKGVKIALASAVSSVAATSYAQAAIDTTATVTALGDIPTAVAAVGAAMCAAAAVAVGWKWLKAAIFG